MKVIAETAFNHEGDIEYLRSLVVEVASTGAEYIKFQVLLEPSAFVSRGSATFEKIDGWCFTKSQWLSVFELAESLGVRLFLLTLDLRSVELCTRPSVEYVEVHPVCFNNALLISAIECLGKNVVIGSGGRTLEELDSLLSGFESLSPVTLMHGFQAFPTNMVDVKLARLKWLSERYPLVRLAYADHSSPACTDRIDAMLIAYFFGCRLFEVHISLHPDRVDSESALDPQQFKRLIERIRRFDTIMNMSASESFLLGDAEKTYRQREQKVVAQRDIKAGEVITRGSVELLMHSDVGGYNRLEDAVGRRAQCDVKAGEIIAKCVS